MMTRQEVTDLVQAAMQQRGMTFTELAEELGRPPLSVWPRRRWVTIPSPARSSATGS
ncbi:MAG: hypothetical protein M3065_01085 [Actinomycetota bacterium]|nr:hypothetical protein [Actinomycetota bacterium]